MRRFYTIVHFIMSNYLNYIMISVYIFQGGIDVLTDKLMEHNLLLRLLFNEAQVAVRNMALVRALVTISKKKIPNSLRENVA